MNGETHEARVARLLLGTCLCDGQRYCCLGQYRRKADGCPEGAMCEHMIGRRDPGGWYLCHGCARDPRNRRA